MHRPHEAIETDEREELDAAVHVDVEGDLLELAEDLGVFEVWPLEGQVEGEREGEDPGRVAQGQVEQERVGGAPGSPEAGVADDSGYVPHNPHREGKAEENQQDIAVPLVILPLAADY